jgi:hypothetical protein
MFLACGNNRLGVSSWDFQLLENVLHVAFFHDFPNAHQQYYKVDSYHFLRARCNTNFDHSGALYEASGISWDFLHIPGNDMCFSAEEATLEFEQRLQHEDICHQFFLAKLCPV